MKNSILIKYLVAFLFAVSSHTAFAQTYWPANASGTHLGNIDVSEKSTYVSWGSDSSPKKGTLKLNNDVTVKRYIRVEKGSSLTIENTAGKDVVIKFAGNTKVESLIGHVLYVEPGATLTVKGKENARIIIDGGADFTDWEYDSVNKKYSFKQGDGGQKTSSSGVYTCGTLTLEHVVIRNFDIQTTGNNGGIKVVMSESTGLGLTTIKNCEVTQIRSYAGAGMALEGKSYSDSKYTADNIKVSLSDVKFTKCYIHDEPESSWSGVIRANGSFAGSLSLKNCEIAYNYAEGGCAGLFWNAGGHDDTKCVLTGHNKIHDNISAMQGGGIRIETSMEFAADVSEPVNKTEVYNNHSHHIGGGIHIYGYAGHLITAVRHIEYHLNEYLHVYDNTADNGGGGIAFEFTNDCDVPYGSSISAYVDGANIYNNRVLNRNATEDLYKKATPTKYIVHANDIVGYGGGIYFKNLVDDRTDFITRGAIKIYLNGGQIHNNEAYEGGGLYVNRSDVESTEGESISIYDNSAKFNGGGICLNGGDDKSAHLNLQSVEVTNNFAEQYGAGMCVMNGDITIKDQGIIRANGNRDGLLTVDGGGVYLTNGSMVMGSGEISQNICSEMGGGLYVKSDTKAISNLTGGVIHHNSAKYGGGIAVSGFSGVDLNGVYIQYNTAVNGGGVFLSGRDVAGAVAAMKYHSGLVRSNTAVGAMGEGNTGYNMNPDDITGYGGGIYLDKFSKLEFDDGAGMNMGIYDNHADTGADDIFASGESTDISLPDVKDMNLSDFHSDLEIPRLFWLEDYCRNDPNYVMGKNLANLPADESSHGPNDRYRVYRKNLMDHYHVLETDDQHNFTSTSTGSKTYANIAIGYPLIYVSIDKYGMKDGEYSVFLIEWFDEGLNTYRPYMNVVAAKPYVYEGKTILSETVLLVEGKWRITEKNWSWGYDIDSPAGGVYERELRLQSPDNYEGGVYDGVSYNGRRFKFVNVVNYNQEESLDHNESRKVNVFDGNPPAE